MSCARYELKFTPAKCKTMLFNWTEPVSSLFVEGQELEQVELFTYRGSCISTNGIITREITARISKAQAAFSKLRHIWHFTDVSLATKVRVYNMTVHSNLLYGCETWPLVSEDINRLQTFKHRCLRFVGHFSWKQRITDNEVLHPIFGDPKLSRRSN